MKLLNILITAIPGARKTTLGNVFVSRSGLKYVSYMMAMMKNMVAPSWIKIELLMS